MMWDERVAIVGAGLAGSLVAQGLIQRGCIPDVFDKSRGTGGRLAAARLEDYSADLGAPALPAALAQQLLLLDPDLPLQRWCLRAADFGLSTIQVKDHYVAVPRASALTRQLLAGARLNTQTRISAVEKLASGWSLVTDKGETCGPYSHVVLATPAPQAVPLLAPVASLQAAAERVHMSASWVMLLELSACPEALAKLDWLEGEHPVLARVCRDSGKPGRNGEVWQLQARPDWSGQHVDAGPQWVGERLLAALSELACTELEPIQQRVHRWLYSDVAQSMGSAPLSPCGTIGVCGDWVGGPGLDGALRSAQGVLAAWEAGR